MATKGTVSGVIANMVTLVVDGPVAQNEICYISTGGDRLMAEVIKVVGAQVYVQVFESTRGLKVGAEAEFTGHMLEVTGYVVQKLRWFAERPGQNGGCFPEARSVYLSFGQGKEVAFCSSGKARR